MKLYEVSRTADQRARLAHVEQLIKMYGYGQHTRGGKNYTVSRDGVVNTVSFAGVKGFPGTTLPFQFGKVDGAFYLLESPRLVSLKGLPTEVNGSIVIEDCPNVHVLPILKVRGAASVFFIDTSGHSDRADGIEKILANHYLRNGSGDILACQDDLIEAGFADIAKL